MSWFQSCKLWPRMMAKHQRMQQVKIEKKKMMKVARGRSAKKVAKEFPPVKGQKPPQKRWSEGLQCLITLCRVDLLSLNVKAPMVKEVSGTHWALITLPTVKAKKSRLRRAQVVRLDSHKESHSTGMSGKGQVDQSGKECNNISLPKLRNDAIAWLQSRWMR